MKENSSKSDQIIKLKTRDPFNKVRLPILELKALEEFGLRLQRKFNYQDEDRYKIMEEFILSEVKKTLKMMGLNILFIIIERKQHNFYTINLI